MIRIPPAKKLVSIAGGPTFVASKLRNISRQGVHSWRIVPAKRVKAMAKLLNLPMSAIRPDLYD
jgi:hypothetical protein